LKEGSNDHDFFSRPGMGGQDASPVINS